MTLSMPESYAAHLVPHSELRARVEQFQHAMRIAMLDGALITHKTGLYYLAGTIQPVQFFVPTEGDPLLLARRNDERIRLESPWRLEPLRSMKTLSDSLKSAAHGSLAKLGLELDVMPVLTFRRYEKALPDAQWLDVGGMLRAQRSIKTVWEIEQLRAIQPLAEAMLAAIPQVLAAGCTEVEVAGRLEALARAQGHQGRSWLRAYNMDMYWGHLIAGPSGSVGSFFDSPNGGWGLNPAKPDGPGLRVIEPGMPVLVDYVAARGGYVLDQTRTAVIGTLPAELQDAYAATVAVQEAVVAASRPGVFGSELYDLALEVAARAGIADGFGGRGENQARFVGHGFGMEIDELPLLAAGWGEPLQPGMVFALEPKYVHETLGIVGIENSWLVTEEGVERLTPAGDEVIQI
ncbi:MAG: aminopeptidase P family protein [Ardenticatenales bacterium]|nr:aminopeptidase P family protein [Ardenticatenales bacterium]